MKCPFCNFKGDEKGKIMLENEHCVYIQFIDGIPKNSGIIIPRTHRETVFDMTPIEWEYTYKLLQEVKKLLDEQSKPNGYNVGWNVGAVGGQEVFHAHLHIIPRYKGELYAGKGIRYWIKQPENRVP